MSDTVLAEDQGAIRVLTLNRPTKLNAMNVELVDTLIGAVRAADQDDAVAVVILTAAGRAFSAGADMSDAARTFQVTSPRTFSAAAVEFPAFRVRKLVIAAVNGHALGLGFTLAMQCDLRFFAREGRYGIVQVRRGAMPDAYSHWTVLRAVGMARAAELLLTGRTFGGEELDRLGVASRVLPAAEVLPAAQELARDVAVYAAPLSVAVSKRLLWETPLLSPDDVERKETALHLHLFKKPDAVEGPVSFVEKRPPRWQARVSRDWPDWPE